MFLDFNKWINYSQHLGIIDMYQCLGKAYCVKLYKTSSLHFLLFSASSSLVKP